jgi:hypothetical protein
MTAAAEGLGRAAAPPPPLPATRSAERRASAKALELQLLATAGGIAGYFRIYDSTETTCGIQGLITDTAGAGPMKLSTTTIVAGQPVTVATFTLTAPNA